MHINNCVQSWPKVTFANIFSNSILTHIYIWTLVAACKIGLIKILTQDKKQYVDVDGLFLRTTVVILSVAGLTPQLYGAILFFQITTKEINKTLLKTPHCFSVILAPLSLVMAIICPPRLCRIGYSIICATFVIIVMYNLIGYIILINKKAVVCSLKDDQGIKEDKKNNHPGP